MKIKPISSRTSLSKILMGLFQSPLIFNEYVRVLNSVTDELPTSSNPSIFKYPDNVMKGIFCKVSPHISMIPTIDNFDFDDAYTKRLTTEAKNIAFNNYLVDTALCFYLFGAMYQLNYKSLQAHFGPLFNTLICSNIFSPDFNFNYFGRIDDTKIRNLFDEKFDKLYKPHFIPSTISIEGKKDREVTAEGNREKLFDKFKLDTCNYNFNVEAIYDYMLSQFLTEKINEHLKRRAAKAPDHGNIVSDFSELFIKQFITYSATKVNASVTEPEEKSEADKTTEIGE